MAKDFLADSIKPLFGIPWSPVHPDEVLAKMSDDQLRAYVAARHRIDTNSITNPTGECWTLPTWNAIMENWDKYAIHCLLGGNASGKSVFGARLAVWAAATIPQAECYALHVNDQRSIADQQRFVYEVLPDSAKNMPTKKGINHNLQYTQKNGFTDGICILPPQPGYRRGGSIKFYNYAQYQQNDQILEGVKAHFIWLDEKVPLRLMDTLRYRLFTYHGRILLTYTVIDGWNETIEKILGKTRTLISKWCDHPKIKAKLPIMQESLSMDSCAIYYAHTEDNPFTSIDEFWKLNANESKEVILARAYGVPTKSVSSAFPLFNKEVNVIPHDQLPWLNLKKNKHGAEIPYPTTKYMSIDPGGSKNWFMLWIAVDASGTWWVYREWPDFDDWALPGDKNGPATKGTGLGIKDYVALIRDAEKDEVIFERFIDPRMGAAEKQSQDGATTIISDLDECDMTVIPAPAAASEANKGEIEDGIQLISNLLAYKTDKPIDSVNAPHLYVSDRCQNFIYAMSEFTGKLGGHESTKDPIDCIRYLRKGSCEFVAEVGQDQNRTGVY